MTIISIVTTVVVLYYFRNVLKAIANTTESAAVNITESVAERISSECLQATADSILDAQDAIKQLQQLDSDKSVVRPSEYLRARRATRRSR